MELPTIDFHQVISDAVDVPLVPTSLQGQFPFENHNSATAGHQGPVNILQRLLQEGHWVNIAKGVDCDCRECLEYQTSRLIHPLKPQSLICQ